MIEIIFKNEDFVVFNKPNGVLTHPVNSNSAISVRDKLLEIEPSIVEWGVEKREGIVHRLDKVCLLYTSPSPRDLSTSRMPSSA